MRKVQVNFLSITSRATARFYELNRAVEVFVTLGPGKHE